MPGANCSILGCGTCRNKKNIHTGIFKLPNGKDDSTKAWRAQLLSIVTKDRVIDGDLRRQINEDRIHICEKHFKEEQIYHCKL